MTSISAAFRSLTEDINTTTPGGRLIFHMFAALAEFERGLIIERTRAGMKAARARGVRPGPKPELSRQQIEHARKLIEDGQRREDVADLCFFSLAALRSRAVILTVGRLKSSGQTIALTSASAFLPAFLMRRLRMVLHHSGD